MKYVRDYFRDRLRKLGLKEWTDGFNFENIPSNLIDGTFHLENGQIVGIKKNHTDQEINFPIIVRVFVKGHREPAKAIDKAVEITQNLIIDACNPVYALTQANGIKNVIFESASQTILQPDNDNIVMAEINFRAFLNLGG